MKVLAVFSTQGFMGMVPFQSGVSTRVFDIERLDEAAVEFMQSSIDPEPRIRFTNVLLVNVIPLEG